MNQFPVTSKSHRTIPTAKRSGAKHDVDKKSQWITPKHTPEEEETRRTAILENRFWILRMINLNVSLAQQRLEQHLRGMEFDMRDEIDRPEKERTKRISRLKDLQDEWGNPEKWATDRGYIYDPTFPTLYLFD